MKTGTVLGIGCAILFVCGLVCAGIIGGLGWFGYSMISSMNNTADAFLMKVGSGDYSGAYNSATTDWQQRESLDKFTADMKKSALSEFSSATWTDFKMMGPRASLEGTMTTKSGKTGPVYVTLIDEKGIWKVTAASTDVKWVPKTDADGK